MFNGGRSDKACADPLGSICGQPQAGTISNIISPRKVDLTDSDLFIMEVSMTVGGKMNC